MGHVDDNDFSGEKDLFAESLEDIERSVSLCTMCELETTTMPPGLTSTSFVPSLPLESTSFESASTSFVADSEETMYSAAESEVTMYSVPESEEKMTSVAKADEKKLSQRQGEILPIPETEETVPELVAIPEARDDDLSASFREILGQATRAAGEFRWEYSFDLTGASNGEQEQPVKQIPGLPVVDNDETFVDVEAIENLIGNVAATNIEAPRIYHSDILDDEIPRKRAKMTNVRSLTAKEIVKTVGRPKIVNIFVPDSPIIFPMPNLSGNSYSNSLEIPIAPKLTKIMKFMKTQVNVEANNASTSSYQPPSIVPLSSSISIAPKLTKITEFQKTQVDVEASNASTSKKQPPSIVPLSSSISIAPKLTKTQVDVEANNASTSRQQPPSIVPLSSPISIAPKLTKEFLKTQVDVEASNASTSSHQPPSINAPASSAGSTATEGAVAEEPKRSRTKKKHRNDDTDDDDVPSRKQRRSSDSWSEIKNAFATPREKEPLACRIKKLGPTTANQAPSRSKALQTAIMKQRNCMRSTLTRLKNLSSYMDQVRDTLLAEDDEDKEYTVVRCDKTTLGQRKIVVSTSTQTVEDSATNLPAERSTRSMISIATQTEEPEATTLPIKTANAIVIDKPEALTLPMKKANAIIVKDKPEVKRCASQPSKPRIKKTFAVDRVTSRAHEAIFNASFDEFRRKK